MRTQVRTAWADVDVQLTRRHDLVPNLVTVVQNYATHEKTALGDVVAARAQALSTKAGASPADRAPAEAALEQGLGRLIAVSEAYPDLKANQNFLQLQAELGTLEEQLQLARRFYNGAVRDLNDAEQSFPGVLVARAGGFRPAELFEADAASRAAPTIAASA